MYDISMNHFISADKITTTGINIAANIGSPSGIDDAIEASFNLTGDTACTAVFSSAALSSANVPKVDAPR